MAKRWYYKDGSGNKIATPQYKVNSLNHYTKAETDALLAEKAGFGDIDKEVYIGSGTPPEDAKIAIDPQEDLVEIVQTTGNATDKVMSQKAVTDAIAGAGGGDWKEIATISTSTNPVSIIDQQLGGTYTEVMIMFRNAKMTARAEELTISINGDSSTSPLKTTQVGYPWEYNGYVHYMKIDRDFVCISYMTLIPLGANNLQITGGTMPSWQVEDIPLNRIHITSSADNQISAEKITIMAK